MVGRSEAEHRDAGKRGETAGQADRDRRGLLDEGEWEAEEGACRDLEEHVARQRSRRHLHQHLAAARRMSAPRVGELMPRQRDAEARATWLVLSTGKSFAVHASPPSRPWSAAES
eukprot:3317701-Rhodomonas_salina.1